MNILAIHRQSKDALTHRFGFLVVSELNTQDITSDIATKLNLRLSWYCGKPCLNIKGERWTSLDYLMKNYAQKINQEISFKEC